MSLFSPRVDRLPREPRLHRGSGHRRGGAADGRLREGRRRVHRRPEQRRAGPGGHRGARSGWARWWCPARSSPTPTSSRRRRSRCSTSGWGTRRQDRAAAPMATTRSSTWTTRRRDARVLDDAETADASPTGDRDRAALRHARRTSSGRSPDGTDVSGAGPADHHAAATRRRRRHDEARGAGSRTGRGARACASGKVRVLRHPRRGRHAPGRRGARRADDQSRTGADHPPGGGAGHRQRRHDLPRRDRGPRAGRPVRRRHPHRDPDLHDGTR